MRPDPVKHPRRIGAHVSYALDLLTENGATNIRVYKTRHVAIVFNVGRHELTIRCACTPRSEDHQKDFIRQALTKEVEKALEGARG